MARTARHGRPSRANGARATGGRLASGVAYARPRQLDEAVQRLGVGERFAAGGLLGRVAHEDALDRDLEDLARERARDLGDGHDVAGDMARRDVLADALADRR